MKCVPRFKPILASTFLVAMVGCKSVPTYTESKHLNAPSSNSGTVLFKPFKVPKKEAGVKLVSFLAALSGSNLPAYSTSIYDVTDGIRYVGLVAAGGSNGNFDRWVKAEVPEGRRVFMLHVEGTSRTDFAEVVVRPGNIEFIALSPEGLGRYPHMRPLLVQYEHIAPCMRAKAQNRKDLRDEVSAIMHRFGFTREHSYYESLCLSISPYSRRVNILNEEGFKRFEERKEKISGLKIQYYNEWKQERDPELRIPFDILTRQEIGEDLKDPGHTLSVEN